MKKRMVRRGTSMCAALIASSMLLTACAGADSAADGKPSYEDLETQLTEMTAARDEIQSKLDTVQAELIDVKHELARVQAESATKEAEKFVKAEDVTLEVLSKKEIPMDSNNWIFSNQVELSIKTTNNTAKTIKGILVHITVYDMFDGVVNRLKYESTSKSIPAGGYIVEDDVTYEMNQFDNDDMNFFCEKYENLRFEFEVQQIIFEDGTKKSVA